MDGETLPPQPRHRRCDCPHYPRARSCLLAAQDETTISSSPHISGMPEGIPPGLRPHGEAMRLVADRNFPHLSGRCVDCVHDVVVPTGKPERIGSILGRVIFPFLGIYGAASSPSKRSLTACATSCLNSISRSPWSSQALIRRRCFLACNSRRMPCLRATKSSCSGT